MNLLIAKSDTQLMVYRNLSEPTPIAAEITASSETPGSKPPADPLAGGGEIAPLRPSPDLDPPNSQSGAKIRSR